MKKILFFLFLAFPLFVRADFSIDLPRTGNAFDRFSGNRNVVRHKVYKDTLVANQNETNNLELVVEAPRGEEITALTVATEVQSSEPYRPYLEVTLLIPGGSPDSIPLFIQRPGEAHAFDSHAETVAGLQARRLILRFRFRNVWTNGEGESNLLLRGVRVKLKTRRAETPDVEFPDNTNVFLSDRDAVCTVMVPGEYLLSNATGTVSRSVAAAGDGRLNCGTLPPGFYTLRRDGREMARFVVVAPDIQKHAGKSVAQLDFGRNGLWPAELTRKAARLARLAGVTRIRERWAYSWRSIEPERGKFITGPMKEFLQLEKAENLRISFILMDRPDWLNPGAGYGEDLRETYRIAAEMAGIFAGEIDTWEYWNEPDSWPFGKGPAHNYASALKAAALGFRSADAATPVAMAGISSIARYQFIDNLLANDVVPYFDVYNAHIYEQPGDYPQVYALHNELQSKYRFTHRPKWITEGGAENARIDIKKNPPRYRMEAEVPPGTLQDSVRADVLPPELRAGVSADLLKAWVYSAAADWESYYTFCFLYYNESGRIWGVLAPGMTATSSYAVLAAYNWLLGDLDYAGTLNALPPGVQGHLYAKEGCFRAVLWNDGAEPVRLALDGVKQCRAMTGDEMPVPETLGKEPVFFEFGAEPPAFTPVPERASAAPDLRPASPIVLEFDREKVNGVPFRVNTQREEIVTRLRETISGTLYCYNFGREPFSGTLRSQLPPGWSCRLDGEQIELAPGERRAVNCVLETPAEPFSGVQRPELQLGDARTVLAFRCDAVLSADKIAPVTGLQVEPVTPSGGKLNGHSVAFDFSGDTPTVRLVARLPEGGDGIGFRMKRTSEKQPSYLDITVKNADGSLSCLKPNLFPLFLDGVEEETHLIRFDQLTPRAAAPREVIFGFCSFGPQELTLELPEIYVWKAKKE